MQLIILAIGHKMPEWIKIGFNEYSKRMPPNYKIVLKEIKSFSRSNVKNKKLILLSEEEKITSEIPKESFLVALDQKGKHLTTIEFSECLNIWRQNSKNIFFIIGGPDGLSERIKKKTNYILSISKFTIPHFLVRLILVEQIYRSVSILTRHPYHRS
tara:strand:- start:236 stop:706 length:471 start_codon:yes stop_codon:yes gene_type:complete